MARREWGLLCPEGHGLLHQREDWTKRGVAWCPDSEHGGNGRFWRLNEAEEGWFDPTRTEAPDRSRADELAEKTAARVAAWEENRRRHMTEQKTPKEPRTPKAAPEPQSCLCGCGGTTKGGRFIPGHDARYHARIRKLEAVGVAHDEAAKIASKGADAFDAQLRKLTPKAESAPKAEPAPKAAAKPSGRRVKAKAPDLTARADEAPDTEAAQTFEV